MMARRAAHGAGPRTLALPCYRWRGPRRGRCRWWRRPAAYGAHSRSL